MGVEGIWKKPHLSKKSQFERGEGIKCLGIKKNHEFEACKVFLKTVSFPIQDDISN